MTLTLAHQSRRVALLISRTAIGRVRWWLVLVQAEARVAALALGRREATARAGPLGNLLLLRLLLRGRLFAIKQLKLLQHRLLLATADRTTLGRRLLLAIWWRVQVVVREIGGLLQHRRTSATVDRVEWGIMQVLILFIFCNLIC